MKDFNETKAAQAEQTYADVARHFDRMAAQYDDGCGKVGWVGPEVLFDELKPLLPQAASLTLIDLGAGTGRVGDLFKQFNALTHVDVTGVDISKEMLAIATSKGRVDHALVGDVTALPDEASRRFDVVTSAGVLDFIPNAEKLVKEAARALKPGGLLGVVFEPSDAAGHGHKTIAHDAGALRAQFEEAGFSVEKIVRAPGIYTNFKTGAPVENMIMIGCLR